MDNKISEILADELARRRNWKFGDKHASTHCFLLLSSQMSESSWDSFITSSQKWNFLSLGDSENTLFKEKDWDNTSRTQTNVLGGIVGIAHKVVSRLERCSIFDAIPMFFIQQRRNVYGFWTLFPSQSVQFFCSTIKTDCFSMVFPILEPMFGDKFSLKQCILRHAQCHDILCVYQCSWGKKDKNSQLMNKNIGIVFFLMVFRKLKSSGLKMQAKTRYRRTSGSFWIFDAGNLLSGLVG